MLYEQMRMLERIAQHPSNAFYDGKLRTHPSVTFQSRPAAFKFLQLIQAEFKKKTNRLIIDVADSKVTRDINSKSLHNEGHIEVAMLTLKKMESKGLLQHGHLTVLTFYQDKYDALNALISSTSLKHVIDVREVDGFHGGEDEFVLLLFAGTETPGFMSDPRRLNVALTRGRDGLICILNTKMIEEIRRHAKMFKFINDAKRCHDLVQVTSHELTRYRNMRPDKPVNEPAVVNPGGMYAAELTGKDSYNGDDNEGDANSNDGIEGYDTGHVNKRATYAGPKEDTDIEMVEAVNEQTEQYRKVSIVRLPGLSYHSNLYCQELAERMTQTLPHLWTNDMIELQKEQEALEKRVCIIWLFEMKA